MTDLPRLSFFGPMYHMFGSRYEEQSQGTSSNEVNDLRELRALHELLYVQIEQLIAGVRKYAPADVAERPPKALLKWLNRTLDGAVDAGLEGPDDELVFHKIDYVASLIDVVEFGGWYGAAYRAGWDLIFVAGPEIPTSEDLSIGGTAEHSETDLRSAFGIAALCTAVAADLFAWLEWSPHKNRVLRNATGPEPSYRILEARLGSSVVGRLSTDDDLHFGFIIDDQSGDAGHTARTIADLVHRVRLRGPAGVGSQFDTVAAAMSTITDLACISVMSESMPASDNKPGDPGGPQLFDKMLDEESPRGTRGYTMVENSMVYVRENGRWVEPDGADDERFYGDFVESSAVAFAEHEKSLKPLQSPSPEPSYDSEDLKAFAAPVPPPSDIRELLVLRLRAEFGFACEIRGDNYYAILLGEKVPEIRVTVAEDRLTALSTLCALPADESIRTKLIGQLNASINVDPMEFSVVNNNVALIVSVSIPSAPTDTHLHAISNAFTGGVRMLADKVQGCHDAVVTQIVKELGRH